MTQPPADNRPIGRIVVVDDDRADQIFYRRIIKRFSGDSDVIMFDYALDALDFLSAADRPPVDIILLDINMPRMDGFEFLQAASARLGPAFGDTAVVMLTSSMDPRDLERAREFEAVKGYLNKPLTVQNLERVSGYLAGQAPDSASADLFVQN